LAKVKLEAPSELYRSFEKTLSVTMRQTHAARERLFVDYANGLVRQNRDRCITVCVWRGKAEFQVRIRP
jgi:hypothetical protein